jgi:glycosyltransferase involved in cell wall biosynthesis
VPQGIARRARMNPRLKIAILTTDNRWIFGEYDKPAPWFGQAPDALLQGFAAVPEEIEVHVVSCTRQPVTAPEKIAANIFFHSVYVPKIGWMRTGYLGCIRTVRRRLRQIQPDLVHGQGTEHENAISAVFSGFPNVVTLLGIMKEMAQIQRARFGSFYWLAARLESMTLRRTSGVLANSRFTQEKIRGRTPKTWLVPNAVRNIFFDKPQAATPRPEAKPPVLLNAGVVAPNKRQNELLDLAEQLHSEGIRFQLKFLGGASPNDAYAARFLARVAQCPFAEHLGFKPLLEMLEHYDHADGLVHVSAIESFGLVVAEALARNLKFVGFNSGGVADIVSGIAGADHFPDGDWSGVKAALRKWIQAGAPRPTTAATIRQRYHPTAIARQHLAIYHEVLAGYRGNSMRG